MVTRPPEITMLGLYYIPLQDRQPGRKLNLPPLPSSGSAIASRFAIWGHHCRPPF